MRWDGEVGEGIRKRADPHQQRRGLGHQRSPEGPQDHRPDAGERITLQTIRTIVWDNPAHFFSQSQRLDLAGIDTRPSIDQTEFYGGSTVLRGGQTPVVES